VQLLYDPRDAAYHERVGSQILHWLDDVGAIPIHDADPSQDAFLFAGARPMADYRELTGDLPLVRDRPDEREPLLRLDTVLHALKIAAIRVPSPRTWILPLDAPLPRDMKFPLFVRTASSSWKKGGKISKVHSVKELKTEAAELRRVLGWDTVLLAREWLDFAAAGNGRYGPVAQEVRTWCVDGLPVAWSFHHMHLIARPRGFPPLESELTVLKSMATDVAAAFRSRLVVADFARDRIGKWWFIEAGPGSCAGTGHEIVFKSVAKRLRREQSDWQGDSVGGPL
jgi:hypothetical protein